MIKKMGELNKVTPYGREDETKKSQVTSMFDKIAPFYDFLNRLLTLRIDVLWRKKAITLMKENAPKKILLMIAPLLSHCQGTHHESPKGNPFHLGYLGSSPVA